MKICYFNYVYGESGANVHVREFAKAFADLGHEIELFFQNGEPVQKYSSGARVRVALKKKFARYLHEASQISKNLKYIFEERRILRREQPDLILTRYELHNFSTILLARLKKMPIVLEVNAPAAFEYRTFSPQYLYLPLLSELMERFTLRCADAVTVVSDELKAYFVEKYGLKEEQVHVVVNGADVEKFNPCEDGQEVRSRFNLGDRIVVGFSGSFQMFHGVNALFEAMPEVLKDNHDIHFLVVGSGEDDEVSDFLESSAFKDRITLTGHLPHEEMPAYLGAMDIALLPDTAFYCSPLKIFEYMAAGKATIAPDVGPVRKIITHGVDGYLISPGDKDRLVEAILYLARNKTVRKLLGEDARKTIMNKYTWNKNARKVAMICRSALGDNGQAFQKSWGQG